MKYSSHARMGLLTCILLTGSFQSQATPPDSPVYGDIVRRSMAASPEIQAAEAALDAARNRLSGAARPLNNPELEAEAESTDVKTYTLGLSQTIDWHDKRSSLEQVARAEVDTAQASLDTLRLDKSVELLDALGKVLTRQATAGLYQRRSRILQRFTTLAARRHQAGDISRAELELARLSWSEAMMQEAANQAALIQARNDYYAISGQSPPPDLALPENLPPLEPLRDPDELARWHPRVRQFLATARKVRLQIQATDRGRKADPSFSIRAGKEGSENLIGLGFSMPLQIRNDFQSDVDAARADALQAEKQAQQAFFDLKARLQAAHAGYNVMARAWQQWISLGQDSLRQRAELLETLWRAGEMSTTDYLLQLQQTLDTQIAGAELQGELWRAWIEWLGASNSLEAWLNSNNESNAS